MPRLEFAAGQRPLQPGLHRLDEGAARLVFAVVLPGTGDRGHVEMRRFEDYSARGIMEIVDERS